MTTIDRTQRDNARTRDRRDRPALDAIFTPRTIAVVGATETPGSVGRTLMENLCAGFPGAVHPVHPVRTTVLGRQSYRDIGSVPSPIDLAVIATPAATVPGIVAECADAGVRAAIIVSAGFRECGPAGAELERRISTTARQTGIRVVGPNCLGVAVPSAGLNATFAKRAARSGNVAFISQSGALCTSVLDWSLRQNVGFSAFVSVGSMIDVGWGDLIDHLGDDPRTKAIAIYMESIGDARSFLSAAREVALTKPIVVLKAGRTAAASKAAASHTGSLTGSDEVISAAFRRAGVLRVEIIAELFGMVEVLGRQPRPKGPRLAIVTNAGGPAVLATDTLIAAGGELASLSEATSRALDENLPPQWSHGNPIDVLGDADPLRYARAVELAAADPQTDGVLMILTPQAMTDPTATAEKVAALPAVGKPLLACWMGGPDVEAGVRLLAAAGIPTFEFPHTAARAFQYMWRYSANLEALYETPAPIGALESDENRPRAEEIIHSAQRAGRTLLSEFEAKQVLASGGIPCVPTRLADDEAQAARLADELGYPVVLKLHSTTITHKSDVGGVKLNLKDAAAVRAAYHEIKASTAERAGPSAFLGVTVQPMVRTEGYEVILGSNCDPQFGPVLLFGLGGRWVELFADRALGLPPLTATLARRLMEQTKVYTALKGIRGEKAVNLAALEQLLVRFSHLVVELPWVCEMQVNPLLVSQEGLVALDARIVLHGPEVPENQLARPAIRPYPKSYVMQWTTRTGDEVEIRPIRPEDEPLLVAFHQSLSEQTVHRRYGGVLKLGHRTAHIRLIRACFADYDREIPLVAEHRDPATGRPEIVAVARLSKEHGRNDAECAFVVADAWQNRGLGTRMLEMLVQVGRSEGLDRLTAEILAENLAMQRLCQKAGFRLVHGSDDQSWRAELPL